MSHFFQNVFSEVIISNLRMILAHFAKLDSEYCNLLYFLFFPSYFILINQTM